jgi:hypothetical protein
VQEVAGVTTSEERDVLCSALEPSGVFTVSSPYWKINQGNSLPQETIMQSKTSIQYQNRYLEVRSREGFLLASNFISAMGPHTESVPFVVRWNQSSTSLTLLFVMVSSGMCLNLVDLQRLY